MAQQVLSITQINEYIRTMMDGDRLLAGVAVRGEISNYKVYPSGHHYFTLKDDGAALKCVMFRGNAIKLRFRPDNGMQVLAMGKISVYPRDGAYQLYCTGLVLDGNTGGHILKIQDLKDGKLHDCAGKSGDARNIPTNGEFTNGFIQILNAVCNAQYNAINVGSLRVAGSIFINGILLSELAIIFLF